MSDYNTVVADLIAKQAEVPGYEFSSPAELLRQLLIDVLTELEETNTFINVMPDKPDSCFTLYDSAFGDQPDRLNVTWSGVQIRGRGAYRMTYKTLSKIKLALQSVPPVAFADGSNLIGIWSTSNIAIMGKDSQERSLLVANFKVAIETPNLGNRN